MKTLRGLFAALCVFASLDLIAAEKSADKKEASAPATIAKAYEGMEFRNIGPFRGGRTVGASGVPGRPNVFYVGVNNGGVWKTDDYGRTWKPLFDAYVPVREWLAKLKPDVAIVVYNDHVAEFPFAKYPTFALGAALSDAAGADGDVAGKFGAAGVALGLGTFVLAGAQVAVDPQLNLDINARGSIYGAVLAVACGAAAWAITVIGDNRTQAAPGPDGPAPTGPAQTVPAQSGPAQTGPSRTGPTHPGDSPAGADPVGPDRTVADPADHR